MQQVPRNVFLCPCPAKTFRKKFWILTQACFEDFFYHNSRYGPFMSYLTNYNFSGFFGFTWVSQVLSAIIASERCFCILQPLRSKTVLRTSTTTAIIVVVNIVVVGPYFFVVSRYRIACVYDPVSQITFFSGVAGQFYLDHQTAIDYVDIFMYGAGLPVLMVVVVITTTIITTIKLRQAAAWRAETSSSGRMTSQAIALTKMLVGNSVLFIVCVFPYTMFRLLSSHALFKMHISFLPSFLRSFLPSFLPTFLPSFLPSYLPSFLPSFLSFLLTSYFLPSFLSSLLPSYILLSL